MSKSRKVKLLAELRQRVPHLERLNPDNNEYQIWRDEVFVTLESLFGKNTREYNRFSVTIRSYKMHASEAERKQEYLRDLKTDERNLESIIAMQEKRGELNKVLRVQRLLRFIKGRLITKIWHESKDFIATIIAKWIKELKS